MTTTLTAAAVLLSVLPSVAHAADLKFASFATAPLARGSGYDRVDGSPRVRHLQRQLRRLGKRPGPIDGLFGPLTEGAVRRFQRHAGLRVDGIVGPRTATGLARSMARLHRETVQRTRLKQARRSHGAKQRPPAKTAPATSAPGKSAPAAAHPSGGSGSSSPGIWLLALLFGVPALALLSILVSRTRTVPAGSSEPDDDPRSAPAAVPDRERAVVPDRRESGAVPDRQPGRVPDREPADPPRRGDPSPEQEPGAPMAMPNGSKAARASARRHAPRATRAAIGYVSVGEDERLENGDEYANQVQTIEAFCRRRGLRLVRIVRDIELPGRRAWNAPGLEYACKELARGEAGALVVQRLGRLTRSPARLSMLLRWFADADRALIAIENALDTTTAIGHMIESALIEVGDWERERAASRRPPEQGASATGGRPAVRDVPELHARIAALRDAGYSLAAIADRLNAEGVPTVRGGRRWRASSVQAAVGYKRPATRHGDTGLNLPTPPRPEDEDAA